MKSNFASISSKCRRATLAWCATALLVFGAARVGHAAPLAKTGAASACEMTLRDGMLTAWIDAAPLQQVLDTLHTLGGVTVIVSPSEAEERVTAAIPGLPLDQAMRALLHGRNFAIGYAPGTRRDQVAMVWIFSHGAGIPASGPPRASEIEEAPVPANAPSTAIGDPDPAARIQALGWLATHLEGHPEAAGVIAAAARNDGDPQVREAARELAFMQ